MRASRLEYRFRYLLHTLVYIIGFWAPWTRYAPGVGLTGRSTWLVLSAWLSRQGWLTFSGAVQALLVLALLFSGAGAWLRLWGAAYVGSGVVKSESMHGETLLADGPYRRTRNPLYLGTLLHTVGVALLMPPSGAVFTIALLWLLQIRLALAEEPYLASRFGEAYAAYRDLVPRFLPSPRPLVPAGGRRAQWGQALLGEFYFVGVFGVLLVFGWSFNTVPIYRGVVICLGLSLVMRAFLPSPKSEPQG